MRYTLASLALAAVAAAAPQGVTSAVAPMSSAPAGCMASYPGTFQIETVNVTKSSKRGLEARSNPLVLSLSNGVLTDSLGRTGYVASPDADYQLQFDSPPQAGAVYTSGFSVCANGSLALGSQVVWQECYNLAGMFYNLYLNNTAPQCSPIYIQVISGSTSGAASVMSDGQPTATPVPICQYSDGQAQVTSCAPVSQISDGQIQATSAKPVTQISDGQIQATSAKPVTQISDGQIQATSAAAAPVTQISDGQIQGPKPTTTTGTPVAQISDGQVQASVAKASATSSYRAPAQYSGAAMPTAAVHAEVFGLAVGALAVALL